MYHSARVPKCGKWRVTVRLAGGGSAAGAGGVPGQNGSEGTAEQCTCDDGECGTSPSAPAWTHPAGGDRGGGGGGGEVSQTVRPAAGLEAAADLLEVGSRWRCAFRPRSDDCPRAAPCGSTGPISPCLACIWGPFVAVGSLRGDRCDTAATPPPDPSPRRVHGSGVPSGLRQPHARVASGGAATSLLHDFPVIRCTHFVRWSCVKVCPPCASRLCVPRITLVHDAPTVCLFCVQFCVLCVSVMHQLVYRFLLTVRQRAERHTQRSPLLGRQRPR